MQYLSVLNFAAVLVYGIILTLSFADISGKNRHIDYVIVSVAFGVVQIITYFLSGEEFLFKSYPLLTHLPLFFVLKYRYKKNAYISAIAVLSAYLFCTPRKLAGTLISYFWNYDQNISFIVQIIVTIPLLIIIIRYVSPYVVRLKYESDKTLRLLISVPLIYYIIEYILTVYTDLLYSGSPAVVEFMDAAVVVIYFIFSIIYLKTLYEKKEIELQQAMMKVMTDQSKSEMESLRKSHRQAQIYRHDLRHHLNYINGCIQQKQHENATNYIKQVCDSISETKVKYYTDNESLNLILSAYSEKTEEHNIYMQIAVTTNDISGITVTDLCSLLSNALENAINATKEIESEKDRFIDLKIYSKNNKLCINMTNSFAAVPLFDNGMPISNVQGHGFGTKSMAFIVEKYDGIYLFSAQDNVFSFQAVI